MISRANGSEPKDWTRRCYCVSPVISRHLIVAWEFVA